MFVLLLVLPLWGCLCRLAMPWLNMSIAIGSETIIANSMFPPITMLSFPSMETLQAEWFTDQPHIARSQIEILVTNDPDEFHTIPDISFRHHYRRFDHWCWRHYHWCRSRNYQWLKTYPPVWLNDTS